MMSSKEDCGETLKAELRALRKKYGGFAVDFMNKVCQIEDGDSGVDPEPDLDGEWNINWPDVNRLADLYTDHDNDLDNDPELYCFFYNGKSFNDKYKPDPTIFLWTINAMMAKSRKLDHPFIIRIEHTTPNWAKILTSNLSERNLSKVRMKMDCRSDPTSLKIWAHESKVRFELTLDPMAAEKLGDRLLCDLILDNRVTKLTIASPRHLDSEMINEYFLPSLQRLKTSKHPALEFFEIIDDEKDMNFDWMGVLGSLSGLVSLRSLRLSIKSQRQSLDFFVGQFLSHPDCKVNDIEVKWEAEDVTIQSYSSSMVTVLEAEYGLKMVRNCPTIRRLNYSDRRIWRYESSVRQHMVSFFIALQQNQVGRGLVLDPSSYRTPSSQGIFSHLLDRAYNRLETDYIKYEEGVENHEQDHPYDGIYFIIKELAGRGDLGIAGDVGEEDSSCIARPSKICKR